MALKEKKDRHKYFFYKINEMMSFWIPKRARVEASVVGYKRVELALEILQASEGLF